MSESTLIEIRDLLGEIRDLLLPVAHGYRPEYEKHRAAVEEQRIESIRSVIATEKRAKAWKLADGARSQGAIAKAAGMDAGSASRFFKALRELGAVEGSPNPKRTVEVV